MPYQNEHSSRQNDPDKYVRIRRQNDKFGDGIHAIFGITSDGKTEIQAIRFDKTKFTPAEAKKWLADHDFKTNIEEATEMSAAKLVEERKNAGAKQTRVDMDYRRLEELYEANKRVMLGDLQVPYTLNDVILHAEGEWNGKFYPARQLEETAWQVKGLPVYLDHADAVGTLVGEISEAYYDPSRRAVVGDVTFIDKDIATKIAYFKEKNSQFRPGMSPTVWVDEFPMPDGRIEARNLAYQSFALVTEPAQGNIARLSKEKEEKMENYATKEDLASFESRLAEKFKALEPPKQEPATLSVEGLSAEEVQKHPYVKELLAKLDVFEKAVKAKEEAEKMSAVESVVKTEIETGLITEDKKEERLAELKGKSDDAVGEARKSAEKVKEALSKVVVKGRGVQTSKVQEQLGGVKEDWTKAVFKSLERDYR